MASPCTGNALSPPLGCEWSRNLVSNFWPGRGLNPGPRSLMAANVITRLRRTPTTAHSHIASEPHFSFCKEMHLPRSHSLHFRIVNILYRAVVMIYPVSASFFLSISHLRLAFCGQLLWRDEPCHCSNSGSASPKPGQKGRASITVFVITQCR